MICLGQCKICAHMKLVLACNLLNKYKKVHNNIFFALFPNSLFVDSLLYDRMVVCKKHGVVYQICFQLRLN